MKTLREDVSDELEMIVKKALEKDPGPLSEHQRDA